jgi:hypothetical protein
VYRRREPGRKDGVISQFGTIGVHPGFFVKSSEAIEKKRDELQATAKE